MLAEEQPWRIFWENRAAVVEALKHGHCDGILPAARGFFDHFAQFLDEHNILLHLEDFPDHRQRRSIPAFFFCHSLLYKPLLKIERLNHLPDVLFRSPQVMRQLGFNARQIEAGFYENAGHKPFDIEALCDFFATTTDDDYVAHQQRMLKQMVVEWPQVWASGKWVMDSMIFATAPGAHDLAAGRYKVCVLALWRDDVLWPMLWQFGDEHASDHTLGQSVIAAAVELLGERMKHLLIDRGFLDGEWIANLYRRGVRVTVGLKENMEAFADLLGLSQLPDVVWEEVAPPHNHAPVKPKRQVTADTLMSWESCQVPLVGCLIRDTYPAQVVYQARVTTAEQATASEIYQDSAERWDIEELFMTLTRYWHMDDLPPSRRGVALAQVHFGILAFTLLQLFYHEQAAHDAGVSPPRGLMPERELAVYAGSYFALLRPSELMEIIFDNLKAWQATESHWRKALRLCEGASP
jgi:hypothetical protein